MSGTANDAGASVGPKDGPTWLPEAHFGEVGAPLPNPAGAVQDHDPDGEDEDGPTPPDVIMMLGFDPRDLLARTSDAGEEPEA